MPLSMSQAKVLATLADSAQVVTGTELHARVDLCASTVLAAARTLASRGLTDSTRGTWRITHRGRALLNTAPIYRDYACPTRLGRR
jgi:hypothetical protein